MTLSEVGLAVSILRRAAVLEAHRSLHQHDRQHQHWAGSGTPSKLQIFQDLAVDSLPRAQEVLLCLVKVSPQLGNLLSASAAEYKTVVRTAALQIPISIALKAAVLQRHWTAQLHLSDAAQTEAPPATAQTGANAAKDGIHDQRQQKPEPQDGGRSAHLPALSAPQQLLAARLEVAADAINQVGLTDTSASANSVAADVKATLLLPEQVDQAFMQLTEQQACRQLQKTAETLEVLMACLCPPGFEAFENALQIVCCHTALSPDVRAKICSREAGTPECHLPF